MKSIEWYRGRMPDSEYPEELQAERDDPVYEIILLTGEHNPELVDDNLPNAEPAYISKKGEVVPYVNDDKMMRKCVESLRLMFFVHPLKGHVDISKPRCHAIDYIARQYPSRTAAMRDLETHGYPGVGKSVIGYIKQRCRESGRVTINNSEYQSVLRAMLTVKRHDCEWYICQIQGIQRYLIREVPQERTRPVDYAARNEKLLEQYQKDLSDQYLPPDARKELHDEVYSLAGGSYREVVDVANLYRRLSQLVKNSMKLAYESVEEIDETH